MEILKIDKVRKSFGGLTAISDVTFSVKEKEIFGIAGPNGSGKSTLFNMISGFFKYEGDIYFINDKLNTLKPNEICKKGIARVFQGQMLFSSMTVYDNIKVGSLFGLIKPTSNVSHVVDEAIKITGLDKVKEKKTNMVGLFEQKLTMIATALATKPIILLLDEPTGGLAPAEEKKLSDIIKLINDEYGLTILIIEHRMKVLSALCERLMILENGICICLGSPEAVGKDENVCRVYLGEPYVGSG